MTGCRNFVISGFLLCLFFPILSAAAADKPVSVHVIIDISGSMKANDPNNLRIPAVDMLVEMLPVQSEAGIWTFGQWINMLVPPATVTDAWRKSTKAKTSTINSHGLRTNIGGVLEDALYKFEANSNAQQSVIFLTDGMVDIADDKDPQRDIKNETERKRILGNILKKYQALGVKIHTIALSDNADKPLLDQLASLSGGMAAVANNSDDLMKIFLKVFDRAVPTEQVPISGNSFNIDSSIQEFSVLIFRKEGAPSAQLTSPDGMTISPIKLPDNVRWYSGEQLDLVTVQKPAAGEWTILGELDPDNRVTVVSDMKLMLDNLPDNIYPEQRIDFQVYLEAKDGVVSQADFLRLMKVDMTMRTANGRSGTKTISDPANVPADGYYHETIQRLKQEGEYELTVAVEGKTFERMRKQIIQVRQPIGFEIRKTEQNGQAAYAVRVIPQNPAVDVKNTNVIGKLKSPDDHSIIQAIPLLEEGVWETIVTPANGDGDYELALNIKGQFAANEEFRIKPDPIVLTFPVPEDFQHQFLVKENAEIGPETPVTPVAEEVVAMPPEAPAMAPAPESTAEPVTASEPEVIPPALNPDLAKKFDEQVPAMEAASEDEPATPWWIYAIAGSIALVIAGTGFFIYKRLMSKRMQPEETPDPALDMPELSNVSLNDGLDDEAFDEDFDLSDDGEDITMGQREAPPSAPTPAPSQAAAPSLEDEIPDFDEEFDIEPERDAVADEFETALEDEIPELEELPPAQEPPKPASMPESSDTDLADDGDAAIDDALASLEAELDDIDIDGLIAEEENPKKPS
jgi:uncharacterized protein (TIGR03503 family)